MITKEVPTANRYVRQVLTALALTIVLTARINPQVSGATLSGTVTDASGAVIPNAQISVKNVATGITRDVTTDAAGFYAVPNLLPDAYEITASAPGFRTEVRTGITLAVGAQQVLKFTLQVGRVTEKVQVTGAAPAVQLATSSLSAEVSSTTVRELPLNGRDWASLATLQPGVNAVESQRPFGQTRGHTGFGTQISISGAKPVQNNYRLDGISINDHSNGAPGSVLGVNLGVDAIQEFSVLTSNYSAEYGKTSGGVVNAITKSGTNQFHGSAYEFFRNSTLDARSFFDVGTVPPFRRNQYGAAAGGPIRKDRTFIFADYEGIRQSKGVTTVTAVPSPAARAGSLCSVPGTPPICTPTTVTVDPAAAAYLPLWPLPNEGLLPKGDAGIFVFAGQQVINENFFTTRIDHKISDKDSLYGTYLYDDTPYTAPDRFDNLLSASHTNRVFVALEESHIFSPTLVNTVRAGYNRAGITSEKNLAAINPVAADPALGAIPGGYAASVSISGLGVAGVGGANVVGIAPSSGWKFYWNSFQGYDDAFLTRGTQSLKFGVAVERMQLNAFYGVSLNGAWRFGSLQNFLTNQPTSFTGQLSGQVRPNGQRQTLFGAYIQDDWRLRPNLVLNLGLRYEMVTVPIEVQGRLSTLLHITDAQLHLGSPYFSNPTRLNFEPRGGFSWDPFRDGKTAVRGGFGLFDVLPLPYTFVLDNTQDAPFFQSGAVSHLPAGVFFTGAFPLLKPSTLSSVYIEQNPHRNYVMQWNLNVQRQITPNLTASAGYAGSHGVHMLFRVDDANMVIPTLTPLGYLWPSPAGSGTVLNPNFGAIRPVFWSSNSSYNALEVGLQKRMSYGLQIQGSLTWGKAIDSTSATLAPDAFQNSISSLFWFDPRISRAVADFNIGRTLVINGTWQVPTPHSLSGLGGWLLGGWELGAIYKANDGIPMTPILGGDPLGQNSSDPYDFPNRLSGPGCRSVINPGNVNNYLKLQCFAFPNPATLLGNGGRNGVIGPGLVNLDFSLYKNNYIKRISENFNLQFRAEFFNLLNRADFFPPIDNSQIFDQSGNLNGGAGALDSTVTTGRDIQFALKLIW